MSKSAETVKHIITEIEGSIDDKVIEEKTMDEIIHIFLENDSIAQNSAAQDDDYHFDMKELHHWKQQVNQAYSIQYNREILCFRKHFRKPVIFVKRIIRKLCRSLIQPIVEEQNAFNSNVTAAINALYNNEIVTEAFMNEQKVLANAGIGDVNQDYVDQEIDRLEKRVCTALTEQSKNLISEKAEDLTKRYRFHIDAEIEKAEGAYKEFVNTEIAKTHKIFSDQIEKNKSELKELYERQKIDLERRHTQEELHLFRNTRLNLYQPAKCSDQAEQSAENHEDIYTGIDYFDFENHFRGSRQEIKEAMSIYIPYFKQKDIVLDLGCGRGEFLELLKENGLSGTGIDIYEEFVAYCQAKQLNAVCDDAIRYLLNQKDNSIGGIFASQLIEHLTNKQLFQLCRLAYEKLEKGGCMIFETPNPMCLSIYMNAFYIDPSHQKPVHPKTMEYLLKREGFQAVEILFTEKSKSSYRLPLLFSDTVQNLGEFNDGINFLSDLLFGSQDYAVIARK